MGVLDMVGMHGLKASGLTLLRRKAHPHNAWGANAVRIGTEVVGLRSIASSAKWLVLRSGATHDRIELGHSHLPITCACVTLDSAVVHASVHATVNFQIRCATGWLWVTIDGIQQDFILGPEHRKTIEAGRDVKISGLPFGSFALIAPMHSAERVAQVPIDGSLAQS
jgi:hypothetical protein